MIVIVLYCIFILEFSSTGFHPCVNHSQRYLPTINLSSESLTGLDSEQKQHSTNYTGGEKAGQNWTEKVMGVKQTNDTPSQLPQDQNDGVDEDEWVRSVCVGGSILRLVLNVMQRNCLYTMFNYSHRMTEEALLCLSNIVFTTAMQLNTMSMLY